MTPLSVCTWLWGTTFGPEYVNRLFAGVARHYDGPFTPICITDQPAGIDPHIQIVPLPAEFAWLPRCCRRIWQYSRARVETFGSRMLVLDLDTVFTGNVTSLFSRSEPLVLLRMEYAEVYSPAMVLMDTGILHGFYEVFADNPEALRQATGERHASDLAMLNYFLSGLTVPVWTRADGIVTYFGKGYERFVPTWGIGPRTDRLPSDARVVILGSVDMPGLEAHPPPWFAEHWR